MNTMILVGTVASQYEVIYHRSIDNVKLIKFFLKVARVYSPRTNLIKYDYIQIKVWNRILDDPKETLAFDQVLSVRGSIRSYRYCDKKSGQINYYNDFIAEQINNLTLL